MTTHQRQRLSQREVLLAMYLQTILKRALPEKQLISSFKILVLVLKFLVLAHPSHRQLLVLPQLLLKESTDLVVL